MRHALPAALALDVTVARRDAERRVVSAVRVDQYREEVARALIARLKERVEADALEGEPVVQMRSIMVAKAQGARASTRVLE